MGKLTRSDTIREGRPALVSVIVVIPNDDGVTIRRSLRVYLTLGGPVVRGNACQVGTIRPGGTTSSAAAQGERPVVVVCGAQIRFRIRRRIVGQTYDIRRLDVRAAVNDLDVPARFAHHPDTVTGTVNTVIPAGTNLTTGVNLQTPACRI